MRLGPIYAATLIVANLERALQSHAALGLSLVRQSRLTRQRALDMGETTLIDAPCAQLAAQGPAWLHLIEAPLAQRTQPMSRRGWMALVVAVDEGRVDQSSHWQSLEGSDFGCSQARTVVDGDGQSWCLLPARPGEQAGFLRGAVLGARNAAPARGYYAGLGAFIAKPSADLQPSTLQSVVLAGAQTIEIREVPELLAADSQLRCGLRLLSFARSDARGSLTAMNDPSARILAGPEGEGIELV